MDTFVIVGGGYTGVEIATCLWRCFKEKKLTKKICIVEKAPSILGPLGQDFKNYTVKNLARLGIEVLTETSVQNIMERTAVLDNGMRFENAMTIWAAGVKTPDFIDTLAVPKNRQGRIKVNQYLQLDNHCFVVGDSADFTFKGQTLRMAILFALYEGLTAGENIRRLLKGKPLKEYTAVMDAGYIVPMANSLSCGLVLGKKVYGILATFLHYTLCFYRSYGAKNKFLFLKYLLGIK